MKKFMKGFLIGFVMFVMLVLFSSVVTIVQVYTGKAGVFITMGLFICVFVGGLYSWTHD